MLKIDVVFLAASLAAVGIGVFVRNSLLLRLSASVNIALIAWLGRGIAILNGDQATAEDYLNGLTYAVATVEVIVAIVCTVTCSWLGAVLRRFYNRFRAGS